MQSTNEESKADRNTWIYVSFKGKKSKINFEQRGNRFQRINHFLKVGAVSKLKPFTDTVTAKSAVNCGLVVNPKNP